MNQGGKPPECLGADIGYILEKQGGIDIGTTKLTGNMKMRCGTATGVASDSERLPGHYSLSLADSDPGQVAITDKKFAMTDGNIQTGALIPRNSYNQTVQQRIN